MIVQNLAVQRDQWLSFICCYVVCEMEKTICPLHHLKFILNSIKNVPMTPSEKSLQREAGSTFVRTIFGPVKEMYSNSGANFVLAERETETQSCVGTSRRFMILFVTMDCNGINPPLFPSSARKISKEDSAILVA